MTNQVATTILAQLGGNKFLAMTGAKNLLGHDNGISMKLPSTLTKGRISHVRITLTAMDDYQIEGLNVRGTTINPVAFREGVYCDNLREVFENMTGLATRL